MPVRRGLPHVADRLRAGGRLTIAFLGGSITWGGNASDIDRFSYRARTTDMIRTACPGVEVHSINAGVGGTGSDLAAFRLHEDVLRHRPDLVLVEFAVNDGGAAVDRNTAAMEGIVRHISKVLPDADICFVYALRKESLHEGGYAPIRANPKTSVFPASRG